MILEQRILQKALSLKPGYISLANEETMILIYCLQLDHLQTLRVMVMFLRDRKCDTAKAEELIQQVRTNSACRILVLISVI